MPPQTAPAEDLTNLISQIGETERGDTVENHEDALFAVLNRIMQTDPESNVVFGNIPKGDAEDWAAQTVFALHTDSPVMRDYINYANMAKRAEKGNLLDRILKAVVAIGRKDDARPGLMSRFKGGN